jgi:hypothetical protein
MSSGMSTKGVREGYGYTPLGEEPVRVNACSLNREYEPVNAPVVVDLDVA